MWGAAPLLPGQWGWGGEAGPLCRGTPTHPLRPPTRPSCPDVGGRGWALSHSGNSLPAGPGTAAQRRLLCPMRGTCRPRASAALLPAALLLHIQAAAAVSFQVLAPTSPLYAPLGGSVELPCHLSPVLSTEAMEVTWRRPRQGQDVHVYQPDGHEEQGAAYRGRTELLRDGIQQGRLALRIWNLTLPDEGPYLCHIQSNSTHHNATVALRLTRSGSDPILHIGHSQEKQMNITCLSEGWYPAPRVLWRNGHGQNLALWEKKKFTRNQGLYDISSSVVLTENSAPTLVCTIRPGAPGLEKVSAIRLSEDFFPKAASWKVGLSLFLSVCVCLLFLLVFRLWRARRAWRKPAAFTATHGRIQREK